MAQHISALIHLPQREIRNYQAFSIIERQLKVVMSCEPGCVDSQALCHSHGTMTFDVFFEPFKKRGLTFKYIPSLNGGKGTLCIKRTVIVPPSSKASIPLLRKYVCVQMTDEQGDPLPFVTILNYYTGLEQAADSNGIAHIEYNSLPVKIKISHVSKISLEKEISSDSTNITLESDPQSLEDVTVSYDRQKKALSTNGSAAVYGYAIHNNGFYMRTIGVSTATPQTIVQGLVPGLLVTQTSGVPGSSSYLAIRGQSSVVNGTDPLYVIDGVPFSTGNQSISHVSSGIAGGSLSPFAFIAPSDIERVDVLKDADATAIYGSRGANGVFLIKTIKRKVSMPKWDIKVSTALSKVIGRPALMDIHEYLAMRKEALANNNLTPNSTNAPDLTLLDSTRSIDWSKWLYGNTARAVNTQLSVSGGEIKNNYTAGVNFLQEAMVFRTSPEHTRLNFHMNYNHQSINRRWTLNISGLAGFDRNDQFIRTDATGFQTLAPNAPDPLTPAGNLNFPPVQYLYYNPLSAMRQAYEARSGNNLFEVSSNYMLRPDLSLKTLIGFNRVTTMEFGQQPLAAQDSTQSPSGMGFFSSASYNSKILEPDLEYRRKYKDLKIALLSGFSLQWLNDKATNRTDTGYTDDRSLFLRQHAMKIDSSDHHLSDVYTAFFTRFNFNWDNRYVLNLTGRTDGSTQFGPNKKNGNFGAAAFAWIFSNEHLIRYGFPFLSFGKIKLSYGLTGNNQIGDRKLQSIAGSAIPSFQSIPTFYNPGSISNGKGWEKIRKTELALDLGFFKNRILFTATAYWHTIQNILLADQSASSQQTSYTSWPITLANRGYELSLSATLADNKNFGWSVAANWTIPISRLASFPGLSKSPYADRLIIGQSINVLKGYVYTGVDKKTGLYSFADEDGDGKLTDVDRKVVGKFDVTGFGGLMNTFRWRNFQAELLFDARIQTGVNYLAAVFANNPPGTLQAGLSSNVPKILANHWRHTNDNAAYQRIAAFPDAEALSALSNYNASSALFENASFLRLRKFSFSYSIRPANPQKMHVSALTFFVVAQNLFERTPYKGGDPEIQSLMILPTLRTMEAGIRLAL